MRPRGGLAVEAELAAFLLLLLRPDELELLEGIVGIRRLDRVGRDRRGERGRELGDLRRLVRRGRRGCMVLEPRERTLLADDADVHGAGRGLAPVVPVREVGQRAVVAAERLVDVPPGLREVLVSRDTGLCVAERGLRGLDVLPRVLDVVFGDVLQRLLLGGDRGLQARGRAGLVVCDRIGTGDRDRNRDRPQNSEAPYSHWLRDPYHVCWNCVQEQPEGPLRPLTVPK